MQFDEVEAGGWEAPAVERSLLGDRPVAARGLRSVHSSPSAVLDLLADLSTSEAAQQARKLRTAEIGRDVLAGQNAAKEAADAAAAAAQAASAAAAQAALVTATAAGVAGSLAKAIDSDQDVQAAQSALAAARTTANQANRKAAEAARAARAAEAAARAAASAAASVGFDPCARLRLATPF